MTSGMLEVRYLFARSVTADASRRLLTWLLEHGADELTVVVMALQGEPAQTADAFEDALAPFELPPARRRVLTDAEGSEPTREVRRWALTAESLAALLPFFASGVFSYRVGPTGWLEDLTVYRRGELVLGVVSHEDEGVLRVSPAEHAELRALGVTSAATGERVAY